MPIIEMHMMEGRTPEQKQRVAAAITEAVRTSLGVRPESIRVMITEHTTDGFYVAGAPLIGRQEQKANSEPEEITS